MDEICEDTGHTYACNCPSCQRYWYGVSERAEKFFANRMPAFQMYRCIFGSCRVETYVGGYSVDTTCPSCNRKGTRVLDTSE